MKTLFVCSMARMRSKTASELFSERMPTKYAGTDVDADVQVTGEMLEWADVIVCMENRHRSKLRRKFKGCSHKMVVLHIPDEYAYDDPLLKIILEEKYGTHKRMHSL